MNRLAPKIEVEFGSGVTGNFLLIPAGAFYMGGGLKDREDIPRRLAAITKPFYIQETPVTQRHYQALTGQNPSKFKNNPEHPVEMVNWSDSVAFAERLNQQTGLVFRLPTEMEWEYAAGGGDGDKYLYAGSNDIDEVAWYHDNSDNQTHPVKQKKPNGFGLYDMSGNVSEWCSNLYGNYPNQELIDYQGSYGVDGRGSLLSNLYRISRGGSWYDPTVVARVADRRGNDPDWRRDYLGLRLVLEIP